MSNEYEDLAVYEILKKYRKEIAELGENGSIPYQNYKKKKELEDKWKELRNNHIKVVK